MTAAVSRGPERHAMPTVVGLSREAAETAVQRANLSLARSARGTATPSGTAS